MLLIVELVFAILIVVCLLAVEINYIIHWFAGRAEYRRALENKKELKE